ncbi:MAG: hypothetical protein MB55_09200 [marine actinobacterium MedAcidi-G3]|nr:MAG: hypothetical protein MB55_09200 [marine actinobacterium MedAcidi-G3]MBA4813572.1 hypothetical protein [Acidimicrobiales bacterium]|tara:strand:- start:744 stop:1043 length:300 start_codon:yes stop_codon:yes gene_type:complete
MPHVAAYIPNLMDRSRFGDSVQILKDLEELKSVEADLVLVDLARSEVLEYLPSEPVVIGFAPHVDTETLDAARAAGCAEALPRSIFFKRLPALLGVSDG